ncbi:MAG: hypothetical protein M3R13_04685 [Armatimonadota bacterium]|nr:hypothetical protein [Armatimonadota bacterium]
MALNKELDPRFAKAFGIVAGVIGFVIVYALYASLGKLIPLHIDNAYLILYADAILQGNVTLQGWELTTVGFYTELPFYVIAVSAFGVNSDLMRTVPAFIYTINLALIGGLIWRYRTLSSLWLMVPFAAFLLLPSNGVWHYGLHGAMHHVTTMAALICLYFMGEDLLGTPKSRSVLFMLAAVATWADMAFAFFLALPVVMATLYYYKGDSVRRLSSLRRVSFPLFVGTIVGFLLSRLMRTFGFDRLLE